MSFKAAFEPPCNHCGGRHSVEDCGYLRRPESPLKADLAAYTTTLHWQPGPAVGIDPFDGKPTEDNENPSGIECGDRLLVLVAVYDRPEGGRLYWDSHIIVPTESGFENVDGDSWCAWSWSDVSWWVQLNKRDLPPLPNG